MCLEDNYPIRLQPRRKGSCLPGAKRSAAPGPHGPLHLQGLKARSKRNETQRVKSRNPQNLVKSPELKNHNRTNQEIGDPWMALSLKKGLFKRICG
jgi:hypothetical protein